MFIASALVRATKELLREINAENNELFPYLVLWELLTRKEPFEEFDDWDAFLEAVCKQNQRPVIPPGTNPGYVYSL